jgi:flagellar motor switch protein FliN/FliY
MIDEPTQAGNGPDLETAELRELGEATASQPSVSEPPSRLGLEPVHKVLVRVQAVLGQTKLNVGDLMRMRSGDVIDLDRRVGEPVDIWVNNRLIARGEVVLTGGLLGVALTEMVKQTR